MVPVTKHSKEYTAQVNAVAAARAAGASDDNLGAIGIAAGWKETLICMIEEVEKFKQNVVGCQFNGYPMVDRSTAREWLSALAKACEL